MRDDEKDPQAALAGVAARIAERPAAEWERRFAGRDVCAATVRGLEEALADPQFAGRGLFAHTLDDGGAGRGAPLPALSVPVAPGLRGEPRARAAPALGESDSLLAPPLAAE